MTTWRERLGEQAWAEVIQEIGPPCAVAIAAKPVWIDVRIYGAVGDAAEDAAEDVLGCVYVRLEAMRRVIAAARRTVQCWQFCRPNGTYMHPYTESPALWGRLSELERAVFALESKQGE